MSESESISSSVEVNGCAIWYEKFGSGPKPLLLISGAIGTGRTDFLPQLEDEDALDFKKFTIIAVEPLGWGRSRSRERKYGNNQYNSDAECFHEVMRRLSYNKYSVMGWSHGAKVALLMAINYSNAIESLVLISLSTYVSQNSWKFLSSTKSVESWGKDKIECYLRSYENKDEIQKLWTKFLKFVEFYNQYFPKDIYKNKYHLVKCPVLIMHGERDQMIEVEQPLNVCKKLRNARLHRFPYAAHDLHHKYATNFKQLAEQHLLNPGVVYDNRDINEFEEQLPFYELANQ